MFKLLWKPFWIATQLYGQNECISLCGFWGGRFEKAFFDVRVFNPGAPSNQQPQMSGTYRKHEKEKRRHMSLESTKLSGRHLHLWSFLPQVGYGTIRTDLLSATGGPVRGASQHAFQLDHVMDAYTPKFCSAPSIDHVL